MRARFAIEQLTRTLPRTAFPLALDELSKRGVPIAASGLFDFDGDGEAEHWFTVRHPGQSKTELWIVARKPEGMKALRMSEINGTPSFVRLNTGDEARGTMQVKAGGVESFFEFVRAPNTSEPFVAVIETTSAPPETATTLIRTATDDLFAGADPATVRAVLLKARETRDFDCEAVDCPQFEYLLGLTYELTGDEREAVEAYLNLWRTYPDSPFTIMARAKLELVP